MEKNEEAEEKKTEIAEVVRPRRPLEKCNCRGRDGALDSFHNQVPLWLSLRMQIGVDCNQQKVIWA